MALVSDSAAGWTLWTLAPRPIASAASSAAGSIRPCVAGERHQLGTGGVELGRAALVGVHVRLGVAVDRAPGRGEAGEGQRVGGGAGGDEVHLGLGRLEDRARAAAATRAMTASAP